MDNKQDTFNNLASQQDIHEYKLTLESIQTVKKGSYAIGLVDLGLGIFVKKMLRITMPHLPPWLEANFLNGVYNYSIKTTKTDIGVDLLPDFNILSMDIYDSPLKYHYNGNVYSIYDGDTLTYSFDLGFNTYNLKQKARFNRINAYEVTGGEKALGIPGRDFLRELLEGKDVLIETHKGKRNNEDKKGKYGRWLVEVLFRDGGQWINVNDLLVTKGFAQYKAY